MSENIKVYVRIKPQLKEVTEESPINTISDTSIIVGQKPFTFDHIYNKDTKNNEIFEKTGKQLIDNLLNGYNSTIFAYGQTGSGKTYTMMGDLNTSNITKNNGLIQNCIDYLFFILNQNNTSYILKIRFLEIYNEKIFDLLSVDNNILSLREDFTKGVFPDGAKEEIVENFEAAIKILSKGIKSRSVGETMMNSESSRSHAIFTLELEQKANESKFVTSKLHFVDLAGSERQKMTQAEGKRLKEGANINKSLSTLGSVINCLVENMSRSKKIHIRYRDSKLTFLLKDSLGGNSKTMIIANVSMDKDSFLENLGTVMFAQRAKMIKNKATINEKDNRSIEELLKENKILKEENEELKIKLKTYNNDNNSYKNNFEEINKNNIQNLIELTHIKESKILENNLLSNIKINNFNNSSLIDIYNNRNNNDNCVSYNNCNNDEYTRSLAELERGLSESLKLLSKTQQMLENEIKKKEKLLDDIFHKKPLNLSNWNSKEIITTLKEGNNYLKELSFNLENSLTFRKSLFSNNKYNDDIINFLKTNEKESKIVTKKISENNEIIKLKEELFNLKNKINFLEEELDNSNNIITNMKSKIVYIINNSKLKLEKYKNQLEGKEVSNNYEKELDFLNNTISLKNSEIVELNEKIHNLKKEVIDIKKIKEQTELFNSKYIEENSIYKEEIEKLNENIFYLENTKFKLIQWNENNLKEKNELKEKLDYYELNNFTNNKEKQDEIIKLEDNFNELSIKYNKLFEDNNILETTLNYKDQQIETHKANINNLQENNIAYNKTIIKLNKDVDNLKKNNKELNIIIKNDKFHLSNIITQFEDKLMATNNEINELTKNVLNKEKEIDLKNTKLDKLDKKYKKNKIEIKSLKDNNCNLKDSINILKKDNLELNEALNNSEIEKNNLIATIDSLNNDIENNNKEINTSKGIISVLNSQLDYYKSEIISIQHNYKEILAKNENLQSYNINLSKKNNILKKILNDLKFGYNHKNIKIDEYLKIIEKQKSNINNLENQSNNFFDNLLLIRSKLDNNQDLFDDFILNSQIKNENETLKLEHIKLKEIIKDLKSKIDDIYKNSSKDNTELKKKIICINEENKEIKLGIEYKNKEIYRINNENKKLNEINNKQMNFIKEFCLNNNFVTNDKENYDSDNLEINKHLNNKKQIILCKRENKD